MNVFILFFVFTLVNIVAAMETFKHGLLKDHQPMEFAFDSPFIHVGVMKLYLLIWSNTLLLFAVRSHKKCILNLGLLRSRTLSRRP